VPATVDVIIGFLAFAIPAVVVIALAVVAVRSVGPFVDQTALWRARPDLTTPPGVQEEDPRRWDFRGARTRGSPARRSGEDGTVHPPAAEAG
jgi:hypothetical protein